MRENYLTENEKQSMTEMQLKAYEVALPNEIESYRNKMLLIVNDSLEASSQMATLPEKLSRAEVWTRLLFGIIPEPELQLAFDLAFSMHATAFPVNAYDLKKAWETFDAKRKAREYVEEQARLDAEYEKRMVLRVPIPPHEGVEIVRQYLAVKGIDGGELVNNVVSILDAKEGTAGA